MTGISLGDNRYLGNLGSILLAAVAISVSISLLIKSEKKKAAVGRRCVLPHQPRMLEMLTDFYLREMQLFLLGYILISVCEIFSVGEFPINKQVRMVSHTPTPWRNGSRAAPTCTDAIR